ncbi:MAG TPA: isocitrate lyase/PEP mutase family protein [Bryobacteraceae bacterium]|nr:isocitrate lyase/PEP mutase family protein [Bryobacteraceae bacterium]HPQ16581.1 isocitrate lyase/PEP mutase family protein [Bryobacteraceae bacterium]HPU74239.1 isocitrate lyase/PEP mutase family protein [Bryobacteraceae bacterium]
MGNCASLLRQKLEERRALPVPGCYDALSARVIEAAGFEAVGITSFGLAGSLLGKPDFGLLEMADILRNTWNVARAVAIPVIADIETGGGNALNVIEVIEKLIAIGIAGVNIEDQLFPSRCGHLEGKQVVSAEEMAGKVRAIASVRKRLGADLVIIARTDACAVYGLTEAIRRANIYLEAGADMAFIEGIRTRADIERAAWEVKGLLSVNLMDAVTGVQTELVPLPELARMGIAQVCIPAAAILVAHRALTAFFEALRASPTGLLAGESHWLSSFEEYNAFTGLSEYRARESEFLPRATIEEKYAVHA